MSLSDPVDWTTKCDYASMERMQLLQSQCEWVFLLLRRDLDLDLGLERN